MRRAGSLQICAAGMRCASGVAPMLHFPSTQTNDLSREQQIERNTNIALEMIRRFKGEVPPAYTRRSTATAQQLESEIEALLGESSKLRRHGTDDQPMDKLSLMERCLRHALWMYHKDNGNYNFEQMSKWLVYTPEDELKFTQMKRQVEQSARLAAQRAKRAGDGGHSESRITTDWAAQYGAVIDREYIDERRVRIEKVMNNTMERDEKRIEALQQSYRKSAQNRRLDNLADLLERFKPVLAREAIMQRLTVKHLQGQLGVWRYLDWCPEIRDRAELEMDFHGWQWWSPLEERRLLPVRLRSTNEVREIMSRTQSEKAAQIAESNPKMASADSSGGDGDRERLLKEVLALQARIHQRDEAPAETKQKGHH